MSDPALRDASLAALKALAANDEHLRPYAAAAAGCASYRPGEWTLADLDLKRTTVEATSQERANLALAALTSLQSALDGETPYDLYVPEALGGEGITSSGPLRLVGDRPALSWVGDEPDVPLFLVGMGDHHLAVDSSFRTAGFAHSVADAQAVLRSHNRAVVDALRTSVDRSDGAVHYAYAGVEGSIRSSSIRTQGKGQAPGQTLIQVARGISDVRAQVPAEEAADLEPFLRWGNLVVGVRAKRRARA